MFCKKCGNEMRDDEVFCTKCGEKAEATPTNNNGFTLNNNSYNSLKSKFLNMPTIAALITLICGLLALSNVFNISAFIASAGTDIFTLLDMKFLKPVIIILYIIALLALIIPIFKENKIKQIHIMPAQISVILTLLLLLLCYFTASSKAEEYGANFSFSTSGIFLLLACIVDIIILFRMNFILKKEIENSNQQ